MKVLAIASKGGHWVQLLRITKALNNYEIIYISTHPSYSKLVENNDFYTVIDGNRNFPIKLFRIFIQMLVVIYKVKPNVILTTGAAPGLMGIIVGFIFGKKTIWVDSIANVEKVSTSGKVAYYFASRVYTQWRHLSNSKYLFDGNVLS